MAEVDPAGAGTDLARERFLEGILGLFRAMTCFSAVIASSARLETLRETEVVGVTGDLDRLDGLEVTSPVLAFSSFVLTIARPLEMERLMHPTFRF